MTSKRSANGQPSLNYHAAYYSIEDGWYMARVLDFPGAVTQGKTLKSARRMARDALRGLAETMILMGEPLPRPKRTGKGSKAIFSETIPLRVKAQTGAI